MPETGSPVPDTLVYADSLTVGQTFELGSYEITEEEVIAFATDWDPLDLHINKEAAEQTVFGGLIASGLHTMSIYQRLAAIAVFRRWATIAGKRISMVNFLQPVRPGDTLTGTLRITRLEFDDRGRALVTTATSLRNQHGKEVLGVVVDVVVAAHPDHD